MNTGGFEVRKVRPWGSRPPVPPPGREAGLSLVELVIVTMIIALLSVVGVGAGGALVDSQRVHASAGVLASALAEARMQAIKRNTSVWLAVDTTANQVQIQYAGPTNIGPARPLGGSVGFSGSPPAAVTFNSLGRLTGSPVTLTLQSARGRTKNVTVSAVGRVRVE